MPTGKTKTAKRPARKSTPSAPQREVDNAIARELRRFTWAATISGFVLPAIMATFVLFNYGLQQERISRLAKAIVAYRVDVTPRLRVVEKATLGLRDQTKDRWKAEHMIFFCLEAERLNKKFKCPDLTEITGHDQDKSVASERTTNSGRLPR